MHRINERHRKKRARNCKKRVMSRPSSGCEKNFEASIDMNIGDKPNNVMLVPDAMPIKSGKFLQAANKEEKYEKAVPSPAIKK